MADRREQDEAIDAAREAVDPERLLPGEAPESRLREDVLHWQAVYRELVEAKTSVVELTRSRLRAASEPPVRDELSRDEKLMLAELRRLEQRLRFWDDRAAELSG